MQKEEEKKDRVSIGKKKDVLMSERKRIMEVIEMRLSRKIQTEMESRKKRERNFVKKTSKKEKAAARRRTPTMTNFSGRGP